MYKIAMIFIDYPYVSEYLIESSTKLNIPIVRTPVADELLCNYDQALTISEDEARSKFSEITEPMIFCNSENSLEWVCVNLPHTHLPELIHLCKDKRKFRDLISPMYPSLKYEEVDLVNLKNVDASGFGFPFILKPNKGFFSLGVHDIQNEEDWKKVLETIDQEMEEVDGIYPKEVMDGRHFLLEQRIPGIEYAVDAFFKPNGTPEIVNIYEHQFSSGTDVSDRVYTTSKDVFEKCHSKFMVVLEGISDLGKFRSFAVHIEFRITPDGEVTPIEMNPMRYGGYCVGDLAQYAWGFNPYEAFFFDRVPNWSDRFKNREKSQTAVIIGNLPDIDRSTIELVDYEKFEGDFSALLCLHRVNYKKYPLFGIGFCNIEPWNGAEIEYFLKCDVKKYLVFKK